MKADARLVEGVEAAVRRLEAGTDAEIIVVVAGRSGSYRDVALIAGAVVCWAFLGFLVLSPLQFSDLWLLADLPLAFLAGTLLVHRWSGLLRLLVSQARQRRQVLTAAAAAFHEESVHATRHHTGLLVYVSALEDQVVLFPDVGIQGRVPGSVWNGIRRGAGARMDAPGDLEHLLAGLAQVGEALAAALPATADNPNEMPDAPRIRP